jgi:hypothetical protein
MRKISLHSEQREENYNKWFVYNYSPFLSVARFFGGGILGHLFDHENLFYFHTL